MIKTIFGEEPFQILNNGASVSPSAEGYTLQYSANGKEWTSWKDATPANETLVITGLPLIPLYFRLYGNNSEVTINY